MFSQVSNKLYQAYLRLVRYPCEGYYYRKKAKLSNEDLLGKEDYYFLGIVAIMKEENDYLLEWIEFHMMMGVEHFILYNNGNFEKTDELIRPYIEKNMITHIPFPNIQGLRDGTTHKDKVRLQQLAYGDCIIRFSNHFKWLLQLDLDEFLFPKSEQYNTITEIIKKFKPRNVFGFEINWIHFGYNYHIDKPKGLVLENFLYTGTLDQMNNFKSIANTHYLSHFFIYSNIHRFIYRLSFTIILNKLLYGFPVVIKNAQANNLFELNHYLTKSKEEYFRKNKIYVGGWQTGKRTEQKFIELNNSLNSYKRTTILRFIPELKRRLKHI